MQWESVTVLDYAGDFHSHGSPELRKKLEEKESAQEAAAEKKEEE